MGVGNCFANCKVYKIRNIVGGSEFNPELCEKIFFCFFKKASVAHFINF